MTQQPKQLRTGHPQPRFVTLFRIAKTIEINDYRRWVLLRTSRNLILVADMGAMIWVELVYQIEPAQVALAQQDLLVGAQYPVPAAPIWKATMPLPRAPHLAEREELDAALQAGTEAALRSFLERHPESRYRDEALAALDKILNRAKRP